MMDVRPLRYVRLFLILTLTFVVSSAVQAQPTNDDLADGIEISSFPYQMDASNVGATGSAEPEFTNVVFAENTALSGGGAIRNSNAAGTGGTAEPVFTNATFFGNSAGQSGAIHNYGLTQIGGITEGDARIYLHNSIVWGNTDDQDRSDNIGTRGDGRMTITHSLVESGCSSSYECEAILEDAPQFRSAENLAGPDNVYRTADDGLRLQSSSPAIDFGDRKLNATELDLSGRERVMGGDIDLGAYEFDGTSVGAPIDELPAATVLEGNFPNPFGESTTIRFELAEPAHITLEIYDVLGRRVRTLVDGPQGAGQMDVRMEAGDLPSGLYMIRLETDRADYTRQMVRVK